MNRILLLIAFLFGYFSLQACNITLEVEGGAKDMYKAGDEIIVKVKYSFTHRVCNVQLEDTKFEGIGLEILGGTDWKEVTFNNWERKIKMKVTGTPDGNLKFSVTRTCDKVGGYAMLALKSKPVKSKKKQK